MNILEKINNKNLFKLIYIFTGINTVYAVIYYFIKSGIKGLTNSSTISVFTSTYCNYVFLLVLL